MSEGLSESRFNMWRAVVALAHLDNHVTIEEQNFVDRYLENVPFSEEQKEILQGDLADAADVQDLFDKITEPAEQGEFFEFARMICWCDGDYDAQEEKIFEHLKDSQMYRVNESVMQDLVRKTRKSESVVRAIEDKQFAETADSLLSLGAIVKRVLR